MVTRSFDYAFIGALTEDYLITAEGEVYLRIPGGSALYAGAGARVWEASVALISRVGANYPLDWLDTFEKVGLLAQTVRVLSEPEDMRRFYAYLTPTEREASNPAAHFLRIGESMPKELLDYPGERLLDLNGSTRPRLEVRPDDLPNRVADSRGVHLSPASHSSHTVLPVRLRELGTRLVTLDAAARYMEPGYQEEVRLLLNGLDAFHVSEAHAAAFFQPAEPDVWEMAEAFAEMGPSIVVIKRGGRGQSLLAKDGNHRWAVPAYPVEIRDRTGAGDAYCGGFLVGLALTSDPLEAALRGAISASVALEGIGGKFAAECLPGLAHARLEALRDSVKVI